MPPRRTRWAREPRPPRRAGWRATPRWSGTASPRCRPTPTTPRSSSTEAEGRELIDVDGRRYLDAISSLWVTTLGHRVPELDEALRGPDRPGRPLHAARQRQPGHDRAGRGPRRRRARSRPALPLRLRRRRRRRTGRSRSPSSTGPTDRRRPDEPATWPSAARTTATPSARSRSVPADSAPTSSTRCDSRRFGAPATTSPTGPTPRWP